MTGTSVITFFRGHPFKTNKNNIIYSKVKIMANHSRNNIIESDHSDSDNYTIDYIADSDEV